MKQAAENKILFYASIKWGQHLYGGSTLPTLHCWELVTRNDDWKKGYELF